MWQVQKQKNGQVGENEATRPAPDTIRAEWLLVVVSLLLLLVAVVW